MADNWDQFQAVAPTTPAAPAGGGWDQFAPAVPPEASPAMARGLVENAPGMKNVGNPMEAFLAGLHMSASGLAMHGGDPGNLSMPKNASFFQKLSGAIGQGVGDLPFNVAGFVGGALGGGAAGTAVAGPAGTVVGGTAGGGAGALALPQAVRETMLDYYKDTHAGHPVTWQEVAHQIAAGSWNVGKAAVIGAVSGGAGGKAAAVAEDMGAGAFATTAANVTAFSTAATGTQAAIDHKAPDAEDFAIATIASLGMAGAGHVAAGRFTPSPAGEQVQSNAEHIYRQTGVPPWEQAHAAKLDPKLDDELKSQDVNGDPVAPKFNAQRPEEPEPFKTNAIKLNDEHADQMADIHSAAIVGRHVEELLPQIRKLEGSGDDAISPKGAIGRYQIMPGTARQYGFDPSKLTDPAYNERVARTVLGDLSRRFNGDTEAVLVAYNAGPGRAFRFIRDGRDTSELPTETQKYLVNGGFGGKGGEPPPKLPPPEEPEAPEGGGKPDFSKLTIDSLRSRFQDAIGQEPTKPSSGGIMRQWVSELESARGIDKEMIRRGLLDPSKDLTTEEMFRQTYASDDRSMYMFLKGNIDAITLDAKEGVALVPDVLEKIKAEGGNIDDFNMYRVAARTVEKFKQGVDTGVFKGGVDEAGNILQRPELQKYKAINDTMQQWKTQGLEYGRDSGLWDQSRMEKMIAANTSHVSLRRIMGDDAAFKAGSGNRGFKATNPLKKMEGSDRQIVEPLLADMDNTRQIVRMADRNRAIGHVIMSEEARGILGLKQLPAPDVKAMIAEPGSNVFKPYGMTPEQEKVFGQFAVESQVGKGSRANQFTFYRDGKAEVWQAKDEHVASLMRGADSPGEADLIMKILSAPAKLERAGILAAPDFALRVPMRHQLTAWVLDPQHPAPYLTAIRGAMDAFGKGDVFWDLMRRGGISGAITEMDMAKSVDKALGDQDVLMQTGALEKAWNRAKHPLQFAQMITEKLTHAERIGYYKQAIRAGIDPNKAAMMGRKAYLDFSEKATGQLANKMAQMIPFFRATMLGLRQGRDAFVDHPGKTAAYMGLGLVVPQIALYALNYQADKFLPEKERYSSLPQWERDQYFITPQIMGTRFKLARPYVIGPMIGTPVERFLQSTFEEDPHAFDEIFAAMASDATPNVMPAAARAPLEQITNHNFFTGHPLVSDSMKEYTADEQYNENTSEVAKKISALLGGHRGLGVAEVSPIVIDNYVQEWSGTTGAAILHALDTPMGKVSPDKTWGDMPFVRGFVTQNPRMDTKMVTDFYTDAEKWNSLHKDVSIEIKRGDLAAAEADKTGVGQRGIVIAKIEHVLNVQRQALAAIGKNAAMDKDEKRQLSNRIYNDAWQVAKMGRAVLAGGTPSYEATSQLEGQVTSDVNSAVGQ